MRGKFIVVESADGGGSTSQAAALANRIVERLDNPRSAILTYEPSGGPVGKLIRKILKGHGKLPSKAMEWLFRADRLEHVQNKILPAINKGEHVVCDRYYPSTLVYQSVRDTMEESKLAMGDLWHDLFHDKGGPAEFLLPDVILYIDVDLEIMAERRAKRGGEPELYETTEYQKKVVDLYQFWWADCNSLENKIKIDGNQPLADVERDCWQAVTGLNWRWE